MLVNKKFEKYKLVQFKYRIRHDQTVLEWLGMSVGYVYGTESGMFEKIENALEGHNEGDTIELKMSPVEGFGDYH